MGEAATALSDADASTLEAIVARLIPSDETGPGAREANVIGYLVRQLGTDYADHAPAYAAGLGETERRARARFGAAFTALAPEQQDAVLAELERAAPEEGGAFFALVRRHAIEGMFGDPAWGGNAGGVGWALIGYPGPRHVWTEADQALDAVPGPAAGAGGAMGTAREEPR